MSSPTWGDTVRVKRSAAEALHPGALAAVCGIRVIETSLEAANAGHPVGTTLYLIEYEDGVAIEVPGEHLEVV